MNRNKMSPPSAQIALALSICLAFALAFTLAGCGQRGPLYLPDKEQEAQTQQSPQEEREENDEEDS